VAVGTTLKAPYPYPGGKSSVAPLVWPRLGNVDNYAEPFYGSGAMLLNRPAEHFANGYRVETVNDANRYIVNFWRSVQHAPDKVAEFADWPVHECDLHARHRWLMRSDEATAWRAMMVADPDYFDPKIAGWWVWGQCCWIGSGWCNEEFTDREMRPAITGFEGQLGRGVNAGGCLQVGSLQRPDLAGGNSNVIGGSAVLSWDSTCDARRAWLTDWMRRLSDRLRLVRTCYGHWNRICDSDSTLTRLGTTGVFLDPPYPINRKDTGKKSRAKNVYATDGGACLDELRDEVLAWCVKWGDNPDIRIALCCYEGDGYESLAERGWSVESWEANGGYGNQGRKGEGKAENAKRERIYFSPACVVPRGQPDLFADAG